MEYSKEFKTAISSFTSQEKDKLIIRLLKKDRILSHRLYFELIDEETVDDKRNQMEELVKSEVSVCANRYGRTKYFLPGIRKISAKITEHVKITTDKFGEVSLNILLINEVLKKSSNLRDAYKLYLYLLNKLTRILILTQKLDPDYYLELSTDFEQLVELINKNSEFKNLFNKNQLQFEWLNPENIPDHLDLLIKDIKNHGFLR